MRLTSLLPMAALVLGSSAPPPLAAQPGFGPRADADSVCAPFLRAADEPRDTGKRGRHRPIPVVAPVMQAPVEVIVPMVAPPPPPPPAPPPPPVVVESAANQIAVTGSRIPASAIANYARAQENRERYAGKEVATVQAVADAPVSTFGVDVDTGSYSNVRRMLTNGEMPAQAAVRTEEMLNYFRYDYPAPTDRKRPFTITADMTTTPWSADTRLLRVGLRGYDVARSERPAANLVFLVDVSGSMQEPDKLPLVKCSLALLAQKLTPKDRVSIVVYAGAAGRVLEPTSDKRRVVSALSKLEAGGSTAGAEGIALAYKTARENMVEGGINRIVLATDGDFNVGVSDDAALVDMVERERAAGITLTTLGFGTGNYNEAMMEQIADHGNGNYSYIDTPREAQKVLDQELSSTLFTIAKDVKIQIEFNPAYVSEYRLIGYENRALAEQDFSNDKVDAGDIGAGHQVTALYEIVPAGSKGWKGDRHFAANRTQAGGAANGDLAWLRLRYKLPDADTSLLIEQPVRADLVAAARAPRGDAAFAAAVAAFGQKLRGDPRLGNFGYADARRLASGAADRGDYWRGEFLRLTQLAESRGGGGGSGSD
jgi:Ca-activated chloride channel family protein